MDIIDKIFKDSIFDELNNMVRWNGMNRIKDETVDKHSFFVVVLSRLISEEVCRKDDYLTKLNIVTYATFHDYDEIFTGDINHRIKYDEEYGEQLREILQAAIVARAERTFDESSASEALIKFQIVGPLTDTVKLIVKVADWLSSIFYLKKEIELGNRNYNTRDRFDYCIGELRLTCEKILSNKQIMETVSNLEIIETIKNKEEWVRF